MRTIRIGNGAGFWGDDLDAPRRLVEAAGDLDYLTLEYLAELTMSILAHQRSRDPQAGYVTDFPTVLESLLPALRAQPELRIVTNAGGINPQACAWQASRVLREAGLGETPIAVVTGDDITGRLDELRAAGERFVNLDTGEDGVGSLFPAVAELARVWQGSDGSQSLATSATALAEKDSRPPVSASVYLGAGGIVEALAGGARIVLTGRVADASLTVGPALHEFGWEWNDWDRLAAATVAGHLIECGAQASGGMFSAWSADIDLANVGYPIAEISDDGPVVITKSPGTGGTVTTATVAEQLVYEIGDPEHYLTPDVDADFSQVHLAQAGPDRVAVDGARGGPPPPTYKVSLAYEDGYVAAGTLLVAGPDCTLAARRCAEIVFERARRAGVEIDRTNVELLGAGDSLPGVWTKAAGDCSDARRPSKAAGSAVDDRPARSDPPEVVLRIVAHAAKREPLERLMRELPPLVTSGPPGVTGYTGPRPRPQRVLAYWPATIGRGPIMPAVTVRSADEWTKLAD